MNILKPSSNYCQKVSKELKALFRRSAPPPDLSVSDWAEKHAYLSPESAAEPGRWQSVPYQKAILEAFSDPSIRQITFMKSARVGYTKILNNAIGYYIHQDPCSILVVQPTVEDAQGYSKDEIAPMLRDTPVLRNVVAEIKSRTSESTILKKSYPGGSLMIVGANSARGFRRITVRCVFFDEVDGYPPTAGQEGDQLKLGERRAQTFWNRKIAYGSTPTTEESSRIYRLYKESDQRRYHVPCPHCQKLHVLQFKNLKWPKNKPEEAAFFCPNCKERIDESHKFWMLEHGKWIAKDKTKDHAGFHIWSAYSPFVTWAELAKEFWQCKDNPEQARTFINTVLGEVWQEKGEAPEWEKLYGRRETYSFSTVPHKPAILTAGVDVQADRLEVEVVAWCESLESYSVCYRVIAGAPDLPITWARLDELLREQFSGQTITMLAVDSGYATQSVYNWVRQYPITRVIAIKGQENLRQPVGVPTPVDVMIDGRKKRRAARLWPVGINILKSELYSWLRIDKPGPCYLHFPEYAEEHFKQLTAESVVPVRKRAGYVKMEWRKHHERNEALDCRVYARAAAIVLGIDRMTEEHWQNMKEQEVSKPKSHAPRLTGRTDIY